MDRKILTGQKITCSVWGNKDQKAGFGYIVYLARSLGNDLEIFNISQLKNLPQ